MKKGLIVLRNTTTSYTIRHEVYQGVRHIVVPVVMMVEGVHAGNRGPLLHLASDLGRFPASWDGIPITVQHPRRNNNFVSANSPEMIEQECVGRVHNTMMRDGKLTAEAWINEARLNLLSGEALQRIKDKKPIDVSVGVFTDEEAVEDGNWNGEIYSAIARNHRPDHLALLPNEDGACNWEDGCGVRVNKNQKESNENVKFVKNKKKGEFMELKERQVEAILTQILAKPEEVSSALEKFKDVSLPVFLSNQQGYKETALKIQSKLDAMDDGTKSHYLEEVFDDGSFVYRVRFSANNETKIYRKNFTINAGDVSFGDEVREVRKEVNFININIKNTSKMERTKKNGEASCPDKVEALIVNEATKFTEDSREWLLEQSPETIELLTPAEKKVTVQKKEEPKPVKKEAPKKVPLTQEQYLEQMPSVMREQMESGIAIHKAQKATVIKAILDNTEEGTWTEENLTVMKLETLQSIVNSIPKAEEVVQNYAAFGANATKIEVETTGEQPMLPINVNAEQKEQK